MIVIARGPVRIGEVWFDDEPSLQGIDVVRYFQRPRPVPGLRCNVFSTPRIDLRGSSEALFQAISSDTRYKIRRAEQRDAAFYEVPSVAGSSVAVSEFVDFFDAFAIAKGLTRLSQSWLRAYAAAGVLDFSVTRGEAGEALVWHAHYCGSGSEKTARLLHSASHFRAMTDGPQRNRVGRVNRFHHWRDIARFKEAGFDCYDLGGWYTGTSDQAQLRINEFKSEFGGTVVETFNAQRALTLKGTLFVALQGLRARVRAGARH